MSAVHPRVIADRYRLVEPLGQGGMGRVWKARDELLHRDVAIKEVVPPPGLTEEERQEMRERALREARAIARLSHPNVVRIFDILRTDGDPWIVMEYVQSRSLQDVLNQDGPLPLRRVAEIGLGMLGALRAAHRAGIVHRDVKPGNVLLADDGRVVLTDFGLATVPGDPVVTRTGLVLGSPAYISPERALDGTAEPPADMWSLGATLYAAVEGQSPYARPSAIATLAALATEPPAPARRAGALKPVLNGLLRKDPADRLRADDIERLLHRAAGRRPRTRVAEQRRPSAVRQVAAAVAVPAAGAPAEPAPALVAPAPAVEEETPAEEKQSTVREEAPPRARAAAPAPFTPTGRPRWLIPIVAAVTAVVVLLLVLVWTRGPEPESGAAPPAAPAPTTESAPAPTTAAPTTPPPASGDVALPAGWRLYRDSSGFSVAVPGNWPDSREGTIVYFREPSGQRRVLGIDQSPNPKPDPLADWTQLEARRRQAGDFPAYQRVRLEAVDYFVKAADWEYTYAGSNGRLHVLNRGFIASERQAHAIFWLTPDRTWADNRDEFDLIARSFKPIQR